jgi:hypothetical protein
MSKELFLSLAQRLESGDLRPDDIDWEAIFVAMALRLTAQQEVFATESMSPAPATSSRSIDTLSAAKRERVIASISSFIRAQPDLIPEVEKFLAERTEGEEGEEGGEEEPEHGG